MLFIVDEAAVVVKQEKMEESSIVPDSEKKLLSCFCPHGYSTSTSGHYHCRHCGLSYSRMQAVVRHEKIHTGVVAGRADSFPLLEASPYYICRHCGFRTRYARSLRQHETHVHAKSQQDTAGQELDSQSAKTGVDAGNLQETKASRFNLYHCPVLSLIVSSEHTLENGIVLHHYAGCNVCENAKICFTS